MQINLTTDYAIRCIVVLALDGGEISSREISEKISVEREFTQKILRKLRNAGLVTATMGKYGGYRLSRSLDEISLMDVMEVTEETMRINRCLEDDRFCSRNALEFCPVRGFYQHFQQQIDGILKGTSFKDLLAGYNIEE